MADWSTWKSVLEESTNSSSSSKDVEHDALNSLIVAFQNLKLDDIDRIHVGGDNAPAEKPNILPLQAWQSPVRSNDVTNSGVVDREAGSRDNLLQFLAAMFEKYDDLHPAVIRDVFEGSGKDLDKTIDLLLAMAKPAVQEPAVDEPPPAQAAMDPKPHTEPQLPSHRHSGRRVDAGFRAQTPGRSLSKKAKPRTDPASDCESSVRKLLACFPEVDRETLQNVLEASGNSYSEAYRMVLESGLQPPPSGVNRPLTQAEVGWGPPLSPEWSKVVGRSKAVPPGGTASLAPAEASRSPAATRANELYMRERKKAQALANLRDQNFAQASAEYRRGNHSTAASLAAMAREYDRKCQQSNSEAAQRIAQTTNLKFQNDLTVDLHHLHVKEALHLLEQHLELMKLPTIRHLHVITGQGKHSANGMARIRPAVVQLLDERGYTWRQDSKSGGCLVVEGRRV